MSFGLVNNTGLVTFTCPGHVSTGYFAYALPFDESLPEQVRGLQGAAAPGDTSTIIIRPASMEAVFQNSNYELLVATFTGNAWLSSTVMYGIGQNLTSATSSGYSHMLAWCGIDRDRHHMIVQIESSCGCRSTRGYVRGEGNWSIQSIALSSHCSDDLGAFLAVGTKTDLFVYFPPPVVHISATAPRTTPAILLTLLPILIGCLFVST